MKIKDMVLAANEVSGYGHFNELPDYNTYESRLIEEAREMVEDKREFEPTHEHLRVLLSWVDGTSNGLASGFDDDRPF